MKNKGISGHVVWMLLCFIIVIAIGWVSLTGIGLASGSQNWLFDAIIGLFKNLFNIGTDPETDLARAISCSYYRCANGCRNHPKSFEFVGEDGTQKNCLNDFCKAEWTDTGTPDGKICDNSAKNYPVIVNAPDAMNIPKARLEFTDCLMSEAKVENNPLVDEADKTLVKVNNNDVTQKTGTQNCQGSADDLIGMDYGKLTVKPATYYIWSWRSLSLLGIDHGKRDTSVTSKAPFIVIAPDVQTEIAINLVAHLSYSEINRIVVKSGDTAIDEAFLKVEGLDWGSSLVCPLEHPLVTFTYKGVQYSNRRICVGETLNFEKFLLTFKEYRFIGIFKTNATFDIKYKTAVPTKYCCSYSGSWYCVSTVACSAMGGQAYTSVQCSDTGSCPRCGDHTSSSTCPSASAGCKWCAKCNGDPNENQAADPSKADKCMPVGTDCGYISSGVPHCDYGACPGKNAQTPGCDSSHPCTDTTKRCENCQCTT